MPPEVVKLLVDMKAAAARIQRFVQNRTLTDYQHDDYFRSAVERQFEIIGEAMMRLVKADVATAQRISEYRKIASFRNAIIHGYDSIDDKVTWGVIVNKLPLLCSELDALLAETA